MIILSKPYLDFGFLFKDDSSLEKLSNKKMKFFVNGSDAFIYILRSLNIKVGSKIIFPSYICNSFVENIVNCGYEPVFIKLNQDLTFNKKDLVSKINQYDIKVIVLVHYFGFFLDREYLIDFCKTNNIFFIEDFSHSFLSSFLYKDFSLKGDALIYSFRKNLAVPIGGKVIFKKKLKELGNIQFLEISGLKLNLIKYVFIRFIEFIITKVVSFNIYSWQFKKIKFILRSLKKKKKEKLNNNKLKIYKFSYLEYFLKSKSYLIKIKNKTKKNYFFISKQIQHLPCKSFFKVLPDKVFPQWLVLYDDTEKMVEYLNKFGVGAARWPENDLPLSIVNNKDTFKVANKYNSKFALIPIHYALNEKEINYIVKLIKNFYI